MSSGSHSSWEKLSILDSRILPKVSQLGSGNAHSQSLILPVAVIPVSGAVLVSLAWFCPCQLVTNWSYPEERTQLSNCLDQIGLWQ